MSTIASVSLVPLTDIQEPKGDYVYITEEFERLRSSIKYFGLFHPIILQGDNPPYKILAGRARFLAFKTLGSKEFDKIPATIYSNDTDEFSAQEISLHENLRRNNLPWYDQVELEKELHDLRVYQHGEKKQGRPTKEKCGWSQNDTARELGLALGTFSQDMALATELKRNPNLRNVKDKTTALKLIKNIVKRQTAEIEQLLPSDLELDDVLLGDSSVILKSFPNETFDLCITDPPWSTYERDTSLTASQESLLPIFHELFRVMKRDSIVFVVTTFTDWFFYSKELPKLGFKVQSYPIIWHKPKTITHGRAPWQFARDFEPILVAVKGDPSLATGIELSSILKYNNLHYTKMIHPHEKPVELIEYLLRISSHPGAKVIDIFAGSGVTLEACKKTDRRFIGIEKNKEFYNKILERIKK